MQHVVFNERAHVLIETVKNKSMVFERKVLRKIFGPTKERDGTGRIKTNDELNPHLLPTDAHNVKKRRVIKTF